MALALGALKLGDVYFKRRSTIDPSLLPQTQELEKRLGLSTNELKPTVEVKIDVPHPSPTDPSTRLARVEAMMESTMQQEPTYRQILEFLNKHLSSKDLGHIVMEYRDELFSGYLYLTPKPPYTSAHTASFFNSSTSRIREAKEESRQKLTEQGAKKTKSPRGRRAMGRNG